ncbi:MAG: hypothetical protein ABIQ30_09835 [Devosia sp.]
MAEDLGAALQFLYKDHLRLWIFSGVLGLVFFCVSLPSPIMLILVGASHLKCGEPGCWADQAEIASASLLPLLASPVDNALIQFGAIVAAVIPTVMGIVCYRVDFTGKRPKITRQRSLLGKASLIVLAVSALCSVVVVFLYVADQPMVKRLTGETIFDTTKVVFTAILTFQIIYVLKLLGISNEPRLA